MSVGLHFILASPGPFGPEKEEWACAPQGEDSDTLR